MILIDRKKITKNDVVVHRLKYAQLGCEEYIGKPAWIFSERFEEQARTPSLITYHSSSSGH